MICNNILVKQVEEIVLLTAFTILFLTGTAGAVPAEEWNKTFDGTAKSAIQTSDGGYMVLGSISESYGNSDAELVKTDANGNLQWKKRYGGISSDDPSGFQQTSDGGYIIAGSTTSYGVGHSDAWIIKTDINGKELWNRTFGGKDDDYAYTIQQIPDGGYIIGGQTYSYGGTWLIKTDANGKELWNRTYGGAAFFFISDLVKFTADGGYIIAGKTSRLVGGFDPWVIKTNSKGDKQWNITFEGAGFNEFYSVLQASDGGYIIAGNYGADALLRKIDANGIELWNKTYGGKEFSGARARFVRQTSDGGYIFAGSILDSDANSDDAWLVKTDVNGNMQWNKTFGDVNDEQFRSVKQTSDGGYILAGGTIGIRSPTSATDFWLVKVGPKEEVIIPTVVSTSVVADSPEKSKVEFVPYFEEWNKTFGGAGYDDTRSVRQTSDGGYILAGVTKSFGADNEDENAWLIKIDANGNELWNKTFEGYGQDTAESVQQTSDGGYILFGNTYSTEDKNGVTIHYPPDAWLIKTDANGNKQWSKTFGGETWDYAYSGQQTKDGGYIMVGETWSDDTRFDAWLIKTDANGDRQWSKTYGGEESDHPSFGQQTTDDGYILGGYTDSFGAGKSDAWLVKTDAKGNELWNRTFGDAENDFANFGQQTTDGGYIIVGDIVGQTTLLKLDTIGNKLWNKTIVGFEFPSLPVSLQQTSDGGYIILGSSPMYYSWLIKTDAEGNKQWNMTFGGKDKIIKMDKYSVFGMAKSVRQTKDGEYVMSGTTNSFFEPGGQNAFLIKVKLKPDSNKTIINNTGTPTKAQPKETIGFEALLTLLMVLIVFRVKR